MVRRFIPQMGPCLRVCLIATALFVFAGVASLWIETRQEKVGRFLEAFVVVVVFLLILELYLSTRDCVWKDNDGAMGRVCHRYFPFLYKDQPTRDATLTEVRFDRYVLDGGRPRGTEALEPLLHAMRTQ